MVLPLHPNSRIGMKKSILISFKVFAVAVFTIFYSVKIVHAQEATTEPIHAEKGIEVHKEGKLDIKGFF
jgi:hypothetical protein